jgi:hypothetical protein
MLIHASSIRVYVCMYIFVCIFTHTFTCINMCMQGVQLKTEPRCTVRFMVLRILLYI